MGLGSPDLESVARSSPAGYICQLFTNPFPPALLFAAAAPTVWPAVFFTNALRW